MRFRDRGDAGRRLAAVVANRQLVSPLVLAMPRGGVPIGAEVAKFLGAPLDVFVARKVGAPGHPEFGIGAIAEGSDEVVWAEQASAFDLDGPRVREIVDREWVELARRVDRYRSGGVLSDVTVADVVLVDDGVATGVTAEASLRALARLQPRRLVLAVPVGARGAVDRLAAWADVVCLSTPRSFRAVGLHYDRFDQVTDAEVLELLAGPS
ncbi:phosphoribosyltransferase [Ilumatobacter sp.]|uniref:phosphoribosyltransferase n=1 Tax=Ilumatobacter sp. TaxID=1967498 RepID=UPI003C563AE1